MADYHRLGIKEKRTRAREAMREPPVRCPECEMAVQPDELLWHQRERCQGAGEPHPQARWVSWSEALALGVPKPTLVRWVRARRVRVRGPRKRRKYLLRDLVRMVAIRRIARGSKNGT